MNFLTATHWLNGFSGILAILCGLYLCKYHPFKYMPKVLRILVTYFCCPLGTLVSVFSILISIYALITGARVTTDPIAPQPLFFGILRISVIISSQQLRLSYCLIILERLIATVCLEKYSKYPTWKLLSFFILLSILAQLPITAPAFFWIFYETTSIGYEAIVWTSFVMHVLTLISCKFLYDKNQQMYKRLAYHCTLHQRHQIVENIKALRTLWPMILTFSIIAPIGPVMTLIFGFITRASLPIGLFYTTYNGTVIILACYYILNEFQKNQARGSRSSLTKQIHIVLSPLGRTLPTHVSQENYFKALQNQWT